MFDPILKLREFVIGASPEVFSFELLHGDSSLQGFADKEDDPTWASDLMSATSRGWLLERCRFADFVDLPDPVYKRALPFGLFCYEEDFFLGRPPAELALVKSKKADASVVMGKAALFSAEQLEVLKAYILFRLHGGSNLLKQGGGVKLMPPWESVGWTLFDFDYFEDLRGTF